MRSSKIIILILLSFYIALCNAQKNYHSESLMYFDNIKNSDIERLNISWIKNEGQMRKDILYYANTESGCVFITNKGELEYNLKNDPESYFILKEHFIGANINKIYGAESTPTKVNYFIGNNSNKWIRDLSCYKSIRIEDIWEGIDILFNIIGKSVEKLFYVKPGTTLNEIKINLEGAKKIKIGNDGILIVETLDRKVKFTKPIAYQIIEGSTKYIDINYSKKKKVYSFRVSNYDRNYPLIIDPQIISTFIGGFGPETCNAIAIDNSGNVFITGTVESFNPSYPMAGTPYDDSFNGWSDIFISKFSSDLKTLYASTYLGGTQIEYGKSIAVDDSGNVFVLGSTYSEDFPVSGIPYDSTDNYDEDVIISKLSNDLSNLKASTYFGGNVWENGRSITIDNSQNVYIAGITASDTFPTSEKAYDKTLGGSKDAFISKFSNDLSNLISSTLVGGSSGDGAFDLILDNSDNILITGSTSSSNYPIVGSPYYNQGSGVIISKFSNDLSELIISTTFGSTLSYGTSIALDDSGNVFIAGITPSDKFPMTGTSYDNTYNGGIDIFISKFNNDLTQLSASTYIGGSNSENNEKNLLSIDPFNNIIISGSTASPDYPTIGKPIDSTFNGNYDVFISQLSNNLDKLLSSTFIGGSGDDISSCMSLNKSGDIYIAGGTSSRNFPIFGLPYDSTYNNSPDAFIFAIRSEPATNIYVQPTVQIQEIIPYPNPSNDKVIIEFQNSTNQLYNLIVYDIMGNVIKNINGINSNNLELDVKEFSKGVYILELNGPNIYRGKFIID